jgi:polyisoprenoid-binding protein YceI
MRYLSYFLILICFSVGANERYNIDPEHSFSNWKIRHVVSMTSGTVSDMSGIIIIDRNDIRKSEINIEINLLGINSNHKKRDSHIKEKKFLDTDNFSKITFKSNEIKSDNNNSGTIKGLINLHGVDKEISMPFRVLGYGDDPWGGYRVGIQANTIIKASDFGYTWGKKINSSLGDEITLEFLIEGIRQ